jgi:hypothetical protein
MEDFFKDEGVVNLYKGGGDDLLPLRMGKQQMGGKRRRPT